jgi:agmatine/peptidylarginine deiminase
MYKDWQHGPSANVTRANRAKLIKALKDYNLEGYKVINVPMPTPCKVYDPNSKNVCGYVELACPLDKSCSLTELSKCPVDNVWEHSDCLNRGKVPGRTYMNFLHLNNDVHVPVFPGDKQYEIEALSIIARETGKRVVKHDGDTFALESGSIHCIAKQIPRLSLF